MECVNITVYDDKHPRGLWRLGRIESVKKSPDGLIRGACVRVQSKTGRSTVLRRPIQHLYPLEVHSREKTPNTGSDLSSPPPVATGVNDTLPSPSMSAEVRSDSMELRPPRRSTAILARDRILGCMTD